MTIIVFFLVMYVLVSISLYFLFPKAGVDGWKGLVPGLNFMEWCSIIGRPRWYAALLLIPIVNIFIYSGMAVDMVRSFGKFKFFDSFLSVIATPISFLMIAFNKESNYLGKTLNLERDYHQQILDAKETDNKRALEKLQAENPYKKSVLREWSESIIFAVFAASFIRMFLIEAYVIPTPSMEGSLLVGDFLFVSKAHYGIRMPQTIAMIPLLHNRIPILNKESYLKSPSLEYKRLAALERIDNNDPIVFNWPVGDSVYITNMRSWTVDQIRQQPGIQQQDRQLLQMVKNEDYVVRPVDKKDHYIKRCIAVAGDSLQIINRQVYINGKAVENPEHMQFSYIVKLPQSFNTKKLEELGIDTDDMIRSGGQVVGYHLDNHQAEVLEKFQNVQIQLYERNEPGIDIFPNDPNNFTDWTVDNFGPIWIPKAGETVTITANNISMYRRIIDVYEDNDLEIKNGRIYINGEQTTTYTFKQDYYWAMGDNRHNSEDSRMWGYVPHDHIVGKPLFIWMSAKNGSLGNGIRWNRIFKSASSM